ncbi:SPOR domain-containing protein [Pleurocapsales cyanobacterium LEGE 10410]|nr:SPOR domain-containing protein [Pleurocapsales cyanobacterium LEGE 10410]
MNTYCKYCLLCLGSILIAANTPTVANATDIDVHQQTSEDVFSNRKVYLSRSDRSSSRASSREYTFKAPDNKSITNTEQLIKARGYKVEVYGSAEDLLLRVRNIEPRAFVKGNVIQVGIFSQQDNAEDLVRQLARAGMWARIITQ